MYAMQYEITLPADYDMKIIRDRVAGRGRFTDAYEDLGFKAYLVRERGTEGSPVNEYAPFYLWKATGGMNRFLWGGGVQTEKAAGDERPRGRTAGAPWSRDGLRGTRGARGARVQRRPATVRASSSSGLSKREGSSLRTSRIATHCPDTRTKTDPSSSHASSPTPSSGSSSWPSPRSAS